MREKSKRECVAFRCHKGLIDIALAFFLNIVDTEFLSFSAIIGAVNHAKEVVPKYNRCTRIITWEE